MQLGGCRVGIVGGGIGGLAAAVGLRSHGAHVIVFERVADTAATQEIDGSSELLIHHFDQDGFATVEVVGANMTRLLRELGAEHVGDARYRLPVTRLGEFCDRRFGVERTVEYAKPPVTEAQRTARQANARKAAAARLAKQRAARAQ